MFNEPYIGMPIKLGNMHSSSHMCCEDEIVDFGRDFDKVPLGKLPLAMSYVPFQKWNESYPLAKALERGTIFPELDLPFKGGMKK